MKSLEDARREAGHIVLNTAWRLLSEGGHVLSAAVLIVRYRKTRNALAEWLQTPEPQSKISPFSYTIY